MMKSLKEINKDCMQSINNIDYKWSGKKNIIDYKYNVVIKNKKMTTCSQKSTWLHIVKEENKKRLDAVIF